MNDSSVSPITSELELALPSASQAEKWQRRLQQLRLRARGFAPFVAGMFATLVGLLLYTTLAPPPAPLTVNQVNEQVAQAIAAITPQPAYSSLVFQAIQPALVFIQVQSPGETVDDEYEDGLGTGVVINDSGEILTSLHVVTNATTIQLFFADGTESSAQIIATQPENDIAVLAADQLPSVLIPATLGNPNSMRVGDEAYAVGHPFGLYASMSSGVISGFERTFRVQNSDQRLEGLIQIDAAVNPGNSGGPLLNRYGQVVGIITGLANPTDESFFVGIGFAVPIDIAGGAAGLPPY